MYLWGCRCFGGTAQVTALPGALAWVKTGKVTPEERTRAARITLCWSGVGWGGVIVFWAHHHQAHSLHTESEDKFKTKKADTYRQMLRTPSSLQFITVASKATSLSELRENRAQLYSLKGFNQNDEWWSLDSTITCVDTNLFVCFLERKKRVKFSPPLKTLGWQCPAEQKQNVSVNWLSKLAG